VDRGGWSGTVFRWWRLQSTTTLSLSQVVWKPATGKLLQELPAGMGRDFRKLVALTRALPWEGLWGGRGGQRKGRIRTINSTFNGKNTGTGQSNK